MAKTVAFLGLGTMGGAMAANLAKAGYAVRGHDPFPEAGKRAEENGVTVCASPAEAALGAEVICSSVPETKDVEEAYLGEKGALASAAKGAVCFDFSTITPDGSRAIAAEAKKQGVAFLDTPVSGSAPHAQAGTLAIMVGGEKAAMEKHRDVLEVIGGSVEYFGENGAGLKMKLVANLVFSGHLAVYAEGLSLAKKAGLDGVQVMELLRGSAIPKMLEYKGIPLAKKDYTPTFRTKLMVKDLRMIAAMAEDVKMPIPLSALTRQIYMAAMALGHDDVDQNAIVEFFERGGGMM
ncbi:MAG: NAD(P)-dependent oxidoreductase [bacterium]|nr:NAD(P)-dependent oxidoreductase [bacterium]